VPLGHGGVISPGHRPDRRLWRSLTRDIGAQNNGPPSTERRPMRGRNRRSALRLRFGLALSATAQICRSVLEQRARDRAIGARGDAVAHQQLPDLAPHYEVEREEDDP
jgi:hypothetical protein